MDEVGVGQLADLAVGDVLVSGLAEEVAAEKQAGADLMLGVEGGGGVLRG